MPDVVMESDDKAAPAAPSDRAQPPPGKPVLDDTDNRVEKSSASALAIVMAKGGIPDVPRASGLRPDYQMSRAQRHPGAHAADL